MSLILCARVCVWLFALYLNSSRIAPKGSYVVDAALMKTAPSDMIVLHPLPRVDEIATDVDSDPRAAYFRQMENGMYVRMALLALVFGKC
jgi:aspartate carbamoyltransferase catalytic subunit